MKRTALFFAAAGALALTALVLGKKVSVHTPPPPPPQPPVVFTPPPPEPPRPVVQAGPGSLVMTAQLSDPVLALGGTRDEYVKIDITGVDAPGKQRAAVNIAVVLDRSGSMAGEKLENARRAAHELVDRLDERDRLAFVTFGSNVTLLFPSTVCTSSAKAEMHRDIDKIYDMGGTNISGGMEVGLREVKANAGSYAVNRLILLSDGEANEGITSRDGLLGLSRKALRNGVSVTSLGVGVDFDEDVMEGLAENGGGNYRFLRTGGELDEIFDNELKQLAAQVASSPSLTLNLAPGVQVAEVYGYAFSTSESGAPTIQLPDFAAGEHRKVVVRLTVPAGSVGTERVTAVKLAYTDLLHGRVPGAAEAALDAVVSPDVQFAESKRDKGTYAQVARVHAASRAKKAATLYSSGNVDDAQRELEKGRSEAQELNQVAGDSTFGAELDTLAPAAAPAAPPSSEEGRGAAKAMRQRAYDAFH